MLPFRSGCSRKLGAPARFFVALMVALFLQDAQAQPKATKGEGKKKGPKASALPSDNIPLPIGQEIKGLVLPDIDLQGHLRSRFEAGSAKRLDAERVQFKGLKVTSFTPEDTVDLKIDLPESTFNVNSRVLVSQQRTTIVRKDFTISGDVMEFNTTDRKGTLTGNVKMVINDSSELAGKKTE